MLNTIGDVLDDTNIVNVLPENNYWAFGIYTLIIPEIGHFLSSLPQSLRLSGIVWNVLDSACAALLGFQQLFDSDTHRPNVTKLKGGMNLGSAAQLLALTFGFSSVFAGIGFATMFGVGLILSFDETLRAFRRAWQPSYWLEDSLKQLMKTTDLIEKVQAEINHISSSEKTGMVIDWMLQRKKNRLIELETNQIRMQNEIEIMLACYRLENLEKESFKLDSYKLGSYEERFKKIVSATDEPAMIELIGKDRSGLAEAKKVITSENKSKLYVAIKDNLLWAVAFTGMLLLCFPYLALPALIIIGVASLGYLVQNVIKLCSWFKDTSTTSGFATGNSQLNDGINSNTVSIKKLAIRGFVIGGFTTAAVGGCWMIAAGIALASLSTIATCGIFAIVVAGAILGAALFAGMTKLVTSEKRSTCLYNDQNATSVADIPTQDPGNIQSTVQSSSAEIDRQSQVSQPNNNSNTPLSFGRKPNDSPSTISKNNSISTIASLEERNTVLDKENLGIGTDLINSSRPTNENNINSIAGVFFQPEKVSPSKKRVRLNASFAL